MVCYYNHDVYEYLEEVSREKSDYYAEIDLDEYDDKLKKRAIEHYYAANPMARYKEDFDEEDLFIIKAFMDEIIADRMNGFNPYEW